MNDIDNDIIKKIAIIRERERKTERQSERERETERDKVREPDLEKTQYV